VTAVKGATALVTGGASGIGKAVVERLASEGASLIVVDLNAADGEKVAADVGGRFEQLDVADPDAWDALVGSIDKLDIAHLNAGVTTQNGDLLSLTEQQYRRVMGANVDGVVYGARAVARSMAQTGGGAIVCTASVAGLIGFSPDPIYTLTKHAVVGFVRAMAQPLAAHGITINAVNPGIVETPLAGGAAMAEALRERGIEVIQPAQIADGVVSAITSGRSGECWACTAQAGNAPHEFAPVAGLPSGPGRLFGS
jgi:NAD(P)-dependent dehydrogenase (short-subunit alcohol dehydrogenase family)